MFFQEHSVHGTGTKSTELHPAALAGPIDIQFM